jgi:tRNA (guanine26-N2/guanine27-N2)-dimethyltransferase
MFPVKKITEGAAEIFISAQDKISKELPVFYNPAMKLNRDITIILLKQFQPMRLCDPLAGSGIRAIRFAKELSYESIIANDNSEEAFWLIKKNMKHNKVSFEISSEDASIMLLKSTGFDYIELDVFGSPNFVLDAAIKRLSRNGILGVTATDTACLSGTIPKAALRKYWAIPKKDSCMHETGIRILIRKVQLIGAQYDKALIPIFSYASEHYFRIFLVCFKGKKHVDAMLKNHGMHNEAGPLWLGSLWDSKLARKMHTADTENKFLGIICDEAQIPTIGFYDIHNLVKRFKLKCIPRQEAIIKAIHEHGFLASQTHFNPYSIRSDIPQDALLKLIRNLNQ